MIASESADWSAPFVFATWGLCVVLIGVAAVAKARAALVVGLLALASFAATSASGLTYSDATVAPAVVLLVVSAVAGSLWARGRRGWAALVLWVGPAAVVLSDMIAVVVLVGAPLALSFTLAALFLPKATPA